MYEVKPTSKVYLAESIGAILSISNSVNLCVHENSTVLKLRSGKQTARKQKNAKTWRHEEASESSYSECRCVVPRDRLLSEHL